MKKTKSTSSSALRRKAREKLRKQPGLLRELSKQDAKRLITELGTSQIELEMQNDELRRVQEELDASRGKYADLYDFAPVGYFTLDARGLIREVNQTGSDLLGIGKRLLINKSFSLALANAADQRAFRAHLKDAFLKQTRQTCEVSLKKNKGLPFFAQLQSIATKDIDGKAGYIRTAVVDVTETKRSEEDLRQSEERYRLLFERSGDAIFILEAEGKNTGRIVTTNRAAAEMHGYTIHDLESMKITDLDAPDAARESPKLIRRIVQGEWIKKEINHRRKDGSVFPCELSAGPLEYADHKYVLAFDRDITERKQAEAALRESEERYRSLVELSPDSIALHCEGKIVYVNHAALALFRAADAGELVGRNVLDFVHVRDREVIEDRMRKSYERKLRAPLRETKLLRLDGEAIDVETTSTPATYRGKPATQVVIRDITERKRAEEALRKSEDRFRTLTENSPDLIALHDRELRHLYVNPMIARLTGLPQQAFVGKTVGEIGLPPEAAAQLDALLHQVLDTGRENIGELTFPVMDAPRFFQWRSVPILDPNGSVSAVLAISSDITERKGAEEALRAAHKELEQRSYELDAVNRELEAFAHTVANDLKAPLRSIQGFTRAVLEDYADRLDGAGRDYLMRVESASQRMTQLIEAMLNMARLTQGELHERTVDLGALAQVMARELRNKGPERRVEFVIAEKLKVKGDPAMLEVMLRNLLDNAWKFTGGHETAKIEFGAVDMDGKTVYFVRDDGAGFDAKFSDKLFKPFQRLHAAAEFPGLGIGLAIANRIILRHNGRLWAEGAVEKGATFFFTL
jgi:PAS domain S-box-containing protein